MAGFKPALRAALNDPEVLKLTGSVHGDEAEADPDDPGRVEQLRQWYRERNAQPDRLDLAVVDKASSQCVGEVVLNEWAAGNSSCNFRTLLGPSGRGRGLGTEAVRMIVGYGFEQQWVDAIMMSILAPVPARARHPEFGDLLPGHPDRPHRPAVNQTLIGDDQAGPHDRYREAQQANRYQTACNGSGIAKGPPAEPRC